MKTPKDKTQKKTPRVEREYDTDGSDTEWRPRGQ